MLIVNENLLKVPGMGLYDISFKISKKRGGSQKAFKGLTVVVILPIFLFYTLLSYCKL